MSYLIEKFDKDLETNRQRKAALEEAKIRKDESEVIRVRVRVRVRVRAWRRLS